MKRKTVQRISFLVASLFFLAIALLIRPAWYLSRTAWNDHDERSTPLEGTINDASHLNETVVRQIWTIPSETKEAERRLTELVQYARTNHLKISVAGARHSMGGHVITRNGIVVDMLPFNHMTIDETNRILRAGAGARWSEVIPFLNQHGLSVEIMQSNNDFTLGGSLSVNCHGWQFNRPPIASSVESLRLLRANGTIARCSRTENSELFSLVLGGYGLFGIILDADLRVVPNEKYRIERKVFPTKDYLKSTTKKTSGSSDIAMMYGRLNVSSDNFLNEGMLNTFKRIPATNILVSPLSEMKNVKLQRTIFRGSVGDDYGKRLRWDVEKYFSSTFAGEVFERNSVLNVPSTWFQDRSKSSTDILVECFVPRQNFSKFVTALQKIIPLHQVDLLNVTVRDIQPDHDSFLRYAHTELISLVFLFNQKRSPEDEAKIEKLTQEMIAAALKLDGKYYLPYRLHATREQFNQAYPQARKFFSLKEKYDPEGLFENNFYLTYGK